MGASLVLVRSRWPQYADGTQLEAAEARDVLVERAKALPHSAALSPYEEHYSLFGEHFAELDAIEDALAWGIGSSRSSARVSSRRSRRSVRRTRHSRRT